MKKVSLLQPPGGTVITPSQALGPGHQSFPGSAPKREILEPAPLGPSVPAKPIHCAHRRQLLRVRDWCRRLLGLKSVHPSSIHQLCQALLWALGSHTGAQSGITDMNSARPRGSSDPVDFPHTHTPPPPLRLPRQSLLISTRALLGSPSSGTAERAAGLEGADRG